MKIISKYKDYYDYLANIYGIDEKLILDRRNSIESESYYLPTTGKITLYIADYVIEGLVKGDTILYGDKLKKFIVDKSKTKHWWGKWKWLSTHNRRDYNKSYHIQYKGEEDWYYLKPVKDLENTNKNFNCPILIKRPGYNIKKYPKLDKLNLPSFISPETIYQWLSGWLSNQITNKENQIKELPNSLKIENKGFDQKRSFRPKMKN